MQYRAVIKKSGNWWIGWLVDLPGVNTQEKTKKDLIESLKLAAEDMLSIPFEPKDEEELVKTEVKSNPRWEIKFPAPFYLFQSLAANDCWNWLFLDLKTSPVNPITHVMLVVEFTEAL